MGVEGFLTGLGEPSPARSLNRLTLVRLPPGGTTGPGFLTGTGGAATGSDDGFLVLVEGGFRMTTVLPPIFGAVAV